MILIDLLLLVTLIPIPCVWWMTGISQRRQIIIVLSIFAVAVSIWGMSVDRWQLVPGGVLAFLLGLIAVYQIMREVPEPNGRPWIATGMIYVGLIITLAPIYFFPILDLPDPTGEYSVGTRTFELTDESRLGVLEADETEPRRLLVRVWYPASNIEGLEASPYFDSREAETTARGIGNLVGLPSFLTYTRHAETNSYAGAPIAVVDEPRPVVFYSHGYISFLSQNSALMEELASHGYIVFSVQHPFDSLPTVFPNGDVIDSSQEIVEAAQSGAPPPKSFVRSILGETFSERRQATMETYQGMLDADERIAVKSADVWVDDRRFVLDAVSGGQVPDEILPIVDAGEFNRTGQMGMSFGGTTSAALCLLEARCAAAVNLDGGDYHFTTFNNSMPVPFLMFHSDMDLFATQVNGGEPTKGQRFNDFSYERHETAGLRSDIHRLTVNNVNHLGVSDFTLFLRNPLRETLLGSIDPEPMLQIQNDFVLGFFDTYLRHQDTGFPTNQFEKHKAHVNEGKVDDLRVDWLANHPEDETIQVMFETNLGEIEIALYPNRAPVSVENFLAYVDGGHYDDANFYRTTQISETSRISVVQGGLGNFLEESEESEEPEGENGIFPSIAHELTTTTGIDNESGTIAYARNEPGTASSEFFFNVDDNPGLNSGNTTGGRDGAGYTTFGRVLKGIRIIQAIQQLPAERPTHIAMLQGQLLTEPVVIQRVYRSRRK